MAKVTFILGNGFDLNCGLKTRFTDMYPSYVKVPPSNQIIEKFKKDIRDDEKLHFEHWSDFEMGMAEYATKWSCEEEMLLCLEDFTTYMTQFIRSEQEEFIKRIKGTARTNAIHEFEKSLLSFHRALPHNDPVRRIDSLMKGSSLEIDFLIFNYTSLFESLLSIVLVYSSATMRQIKIHKPIHIHGDLSGPVLGVDNENQLGSISFSLSSSGKRAFIKPWYNKEYDFSMFQSSLDIIRNSNAICVYGKRFGCSDLTWNQVIGEWLNSDSSHELVYYDHKSSICSSCLPWRKMDIEDEIKTRLLHELGGNESVLPQIHVPVGMNIFNISATVQAGIEFDKRNLLRSTGSRR